MAAAVNVIAAFMCTLFWRGKWSSGFFLCSWSWQ